MEIHRTGRVADWDTVPEAKRNRWQQIAAATHGYITPGNFVSIVGAALAILGFVWLYQGKLTAGLITVTLGKLGDVLDGYAAHYSGTKNTVGEAVDAGLDKVVALVAFPVFISGHIVPVALVILFGVQQLAAGLLGSYARLKGLHMHPSLLGKYSAITQWVALLGYIAAAAAGGAHAVIKGALCVLLLSAIAAGTIATYGYARYIVRALRRRRQDDAVS